MGPWLDASTIGCIHIEQRARDYLNSGVFRSVPGERKGSDPTMIMNHLPIRAWRDLATDWRVWLSLALCLLIATLASFLGYD